MEKGEYPQRLQSFLEHRGLPEQTIDNIGRMCRHGYVSAETALALLEEVEAGRKIIDEEMAGKVWDSINGSMPYSA